MYKIFYILQASDAGSLLRVAGTNPVSAGAGGGCGAGKNELVARGGSGGALALSRAPVGGSASPAPAPLPQPAPSPAPAALPPPALPPPPFRADTPHRPNGAHIPTLDGHAATQIPARPVGAAGPDTPERPASNNNKLQPCARTSTDSPTPAPPAPPAPSPLFPSHTAYQSQSHAAAALPDYRHTNHETRTDSQDSQAQAPLDLQAHHAPRPPHIASIATQPSHPNLSSRIPHSQPYPVIPGHEVRNPPTGAQTNTPVPTSYPNRISGVSQSVTPLSMTTTNTNNCLPSQTLPTRPASPATPHSRPYHVPSIGSSHVSSSLSSSIHSMPYQNQPSLQKHSVQPVFASRPSHLAPFSVANHISSSNVQQPVSNLTTATHMSHPINSHSITNHIPVSNTGLLPTSTPSHSMAQPMSITPTSSSIPNYSSLRHHGLSLPQHISPIIPTSAPIAMNHIDSLSTTSTSHPVVTPVTTTSGHLPLPVIDSRQAPIPSTELPSRSESASISSSIPMNGYPPPAIYSGGTYPPLYAPYATSLQHSPYLPPTAASPRNSADTVSPISLQ